MLFLLLILSMFCKLNFNLKASDEQILSDESEVSSLLNTNQINLPVFEISVNQKVIAYVASLIHLNIEPSEELCRLIEASSMYVCEERGVLPGMDAILDKKLERYARDECGIPRVGLDNMCSRLSTLPATISAATLLSDIPETADELLIMEYLKKFNTFSHTTVEETILSAVEISLKALDQEKNEIMKKKLLSFHRALSGRDVYWKKKISTVLNSIRNITDPDTERKTGPIFFAVGSNHVTRIIDVISDVYKEQDGITTKRILYKQLTDEELISMLQSTTLLKNPLRTLKTLNGRLKQAGNNNQNPMKAITATICLRVFQAFATLWSNNLLTEEDLKYMENTLNDPELLLEILEKKFSE